MVAIVTALAYSATHSVSKPTRDSLRLLDGLGIERIEAGFPRVSEDDEPFV